MKSAAATVLSIFFFILLIGCGNDTERSIQIYSIQESSTLDYVIDKFLAENPGYTIEKVINDDYQKVLEGIKQQIYKPDIIVLDYMPIIELAEKEELFYKIKPRINLENNIQIINSYIDDYSIPIRFAIPFLYSKDGFNYVDYERVKLNLENFYLSNVNISDIVEIFYLYYDNDLIENGNINRDKLAEYIGFIQEVYLKNNRNDAAEMVNINDNERYPWSDFLLGDETIMYQMATGIEDMKYFLSSTLLVRGQALFVQESIRPCVELAVNKNSTEIDACEDFIQIALSDAIQMSELGDGFPVNEVALDYWGQNYRMSDEELYVGKKEGTDIMIAAPPEDVIQSLIGLVKYMNNIYVKDFVFLSVLKEEISNYDIEKDSMNDLINRIVLLYENQIERGSVNY